MSSISSISQNIIPQGTLTRLTEINPLERRRIIDTTSVGIGQYDAEKADAEEKSCVATSRIPIRKADAGGVRRRGQLTRFCALHREEDLRPPGIVSGAGSIPGHSTRPARLLPLHPVVCAASLEKIALEVRGLQRRTEVREVEEYFSPEQKGSSAMPDKRNPVTAEQICGLRVWCAQCAGCAGKRGTLARTRHLTLFRRARDPAGLDHPA